MGEHDARNVTGARTHRPRSTSTVDHRSRQIGVLEEQAVIVLEISLGAAEKIGDAAFATHLRELVERATDGQGQAWIPKAGATQRPLDGPRAVPSHTRFPPDTRFT
ncbi:hypothetical protein [Actinoplanes subglobosus]|uniref:hypothetical protein n=1 Tax=Actinoplanes subglobosus TaxID=1547892 RepID=UPI00366F5DCC